MHPILFTHQSAEKHQVPRGHPERPERMQALGPILAERATIWQSEIAPEARHEQLQLVHPDSYLNWIYEQAGAVKDAENLVSLDPDTWAGPDSLTAARRGAGAACAGVDRLMGGESLRVFSAMRPPGHHAEPEKAMGFCLFLMQQLQQNMRAKPIILPALLYLILMSITAMARKPPFMVMAIYIMHPPTRCRFIPELGQLMRRAAVISLTIRLPLVQGALSF